jgi:hypothetical protein
VDITEEINLGLDNDQELTCMAPREHAHFQIACGMGQVPHLEDFRAAPAAQAVDMPVETRLGQWIGRHQADQLCSACQYQHRSVEQQWPRSAADLPPWAGRLDMPKTRVVAARDQSIAGKGAARSSRKADLRHHARAG